MIFLSDEAILGLDFKALCRAILNTRQCYVCGHVVDDMTDAAVAWSPGSYSKELFHKGACLDSHVTWLRRDGWEATWQEAVDVTQHGANAKKYRRLTALKGQDMSAINIKTFPLSRSFAKR